MEELIELARVINTIILSILHLFKGVEENMNMMRSGMENTKKDSNTTSGMRNTVSE